MTEYEFCSWVFKTLPLSQFTRSGETNGHIIKTPMQLYGQVYEATASSNLLAMKVCHLGNGFSSQVFRGLQSPRRFGARAPQLSRSWKLDPQKLGDIINDYGCFRELNLEELATNTQYICWISWSNLPSQYILYPEELSNAFYPFRLCNLSMWGTENRLYWPHQHSHLHVLFLSRI